MTMTRTTLPGVMLEIRFYKCRLHEGGTADAMVTMLNARSRTAGPRSRLTRL
jgi:hypothetical protein